LLRRAGALLAKAERFCEAYVAEAVSTADNQRIASPSFGWLAIAERTNWFRLKSGVFLKIWVD